MIKTQSRFFDGLSFPKIIEPIQPCSLSEFSEWLTQNRESIFSDLRRHGAILFRSFPVVGPEQFEQATRCLTTGLLNYEGGDSPRSVVSGQVYTSTVFPETLPITLHNEMSYTNAYPSTIFFYCDIPPIADGETPLADCRELYKSIPEDVLNRFSNQKLKYIQNLPNKRGIGKSWQQTYETEDREKVERLLAKRRATAAWKADGSLKVTEVIDPIVKHPVTGELVFFSQAHQWHSSGLEKSIRESLLQMMPEGEFYHACVHADDSPLRSGDLDILRKCLDAQTIKFSWKKNDLLMADNVLIAHGRSVFKGERRILVAMA